MKQYEDRVQADVVKYIRNVLRLGIVWQNAQEAVGKNANRYFATGLLKGAPDLQWALPRGITVWLESKSANEKPRPEQVKFHEKLRSLNHIVLWYDSFEEFKNKLNELDIPEIKESLHIDSSRF